MDYSEESPQIDLLKYWRIIVKRKGLLFVFAGTLVFLVGIFSFTSPPKYKPTATLMIEEDTSRLLSLEDEFGFLRYQSGMKDIIYLNSQLVLIKSDSLAERVVQKMDLLESAEFGAGNFGKKSLMSKMADLVTFKWISGNKKTEENSGESELYAKAVEKLKKCLDISTLRDSKAVKISCTSSHPALATDIVNTMAEEFIKYSVEQKYETTRQASKFLSEQIEVLKTELTEKEGELQRYSKEQELIFLSEKENVALTKFADLTRAFTQAQIDRIDAEVTYMKLKNLAIDSLPKSLENRIIQNLQEEHARLKNEYREKSKLYKPDYPEMVQLQEKMESMREELQNEIDKDVELAESEYLATLKKENSLKGLLDVQKEEVARMNSASIMYKSLDIEVENKRQQLDSLNEKLNITLVSARLEGLKTSSMRIVDKAKVPLHPVWPKKKLNLILALMMGLFGGVGLCFIFEYFDSTIMNPEDVERLSGLPLIGVIPYLSPKENNKKWNFFGYRNPYSSDGQSSKTQKRQHKDKQTERIDLLHPKVPLSEAPRTITTKEQENHLKADQIELVNLHFPEYPVSEDYRAVRTSILLSNSDEPPRTIVFTSSLPMEGKSTTVANLAVAFAHMGKQVLMIDGDMRKPRLHQIFKARMTRGLSGYLTGSLPIEEAEQKTGIENVWIMPSGLFPPNPVELLGSAKMKTFMETVKERFDYVFVDTPPLWNVVDALVIGSVADSVILVVQPEKTRHKPFLKAVGKLKDGKTRILGVLFNQAKKSRTDYYYYLDYYHRYGHPHI